MQANISELFANDTVTWKASPDKTLDVQVISSTHVETVIKLTVDDKDVPLVVGDSIMHGHNNATVLSVEYDGTYNIRENGGEVLGEHDLNNMSRADLALTLGERRIPTNELLLVPEKLITNRVS